MKSRDRLDERVWPIAKRLVESALRHWREPDHGIWEIRGKPRHYTMSKVMCWVAADRGARLARLRDDGKTADRWRVAAQEIRDEVCAKGVDDRGVFTQHYETDALDGSLLLMPLFRFLPRHAPRVRATVMAIADELTVDGLVLRYRMDDVDDGLTGTEGCFTSCSFLVGVGLRRDRRVRSRRELCERLLGHASALGLYAEELDPRTGRHLGNFPQAFTHLALINALVQVIRADAPTYTFPEDGASL